MAEYLIQDSTLTNIAEPIRTLMGLTDNLTTDEMASNLNDANTAVVNALTALIEKEVEVPDGTNVTGLAELIAGLSLPNFKYTSGTIAFAQKITIGNTLDGAYTVEHNLGVKPNIFIFSYNNTSGYADANHLKLCAVLQKNQIFNSCHYLSFQCATPVMNGVESGTSKMHSSNYFETDILDENTVKIIGCNSSSFLNDSFNSENYGYFWFAMSWDIQ